MMECRRANVLYYMPRRDFSGGRTRSGMATHTQRIAPRSARGGPLLQPHTSYVTTRRLGDGVLRGARSPGPFSFSSLKLYAVTGPTEQWTEH
jgi:hypothetical protein